MAEKQLLHRHHIVPLHMGGPKNGPTILLTIEQHAEAHKKLWDDHGLWEDYVAWQCLSGAMNHQEAIKIAISEGGKITAQLHRGMKRSEESRQRMRDAAKKRPGGTAHLRDPKIRQLVGQKNLGKKRSLETRQRMSELRKNMPRNRSVICECCNQEFRAKLSTARYCSGRCNMRAWRNKNS